MFDNRLGAQVIIKQKWICSMFLFDIAVDRINNLSMIDEHCTEKIDHCSNVTFVSTFHKKFELLCSLFLARKLIIMLQCAVHFRLC